MERQERPITKGCERSHIPEPLPRTLIQINPTNGQVAKVADLATGLVGGLIWEPESMTFLGWTIPGQYQPPSLFRFDPATGVTNIIFDPPYYAIGLARSTNPGKYIAWTSMNNQNYFVELDPVARTMVLLGESHHNEAVAMVLVPRDPLAKKKLTQ